MLEHSEPEFQPQGQSSQVHQNAEQPLLEAAQGVVTQLPKDNTGAAAKFFGGTHDEGGPNLPEWLVCCALRKRGQGGRFGTVSPSSAVLQQCLEPLRPFGQRLVIEQAH